MRGHVPEQVDRCRPGLVVPGVNLVVLGQVPALGGILLDFVVQWADQGVLDHLPGWVGELFEVQVRGREVLLGDTGEYHRPKVQGHLQDVLEVLREKEDWERGC